MHSRVGLEETSIGQETASIIAQVRSGGDDALRALARRFDRATLDSLEVPESAWHVALASLDPKLVTAMKRTIRNISSVQSASLPASLETFPERGIVVGRRADPLSRVGVYTPGGTAAYPSSLLMGAVPARIAGVHEIVVCSPPAPDGVPSKAVLAAAALSGVDRVFAIGGAGAIAAMAYGTETVPRVDRIVGPGNAYVAEAKLQVSGVVSIDSPAGPSELLVVADHSADPAVIAREVMAQAEHDPRAVVVVVAIGEGVADIIARRILEVLPLQQRRGVIQEALKSRGAVVWASDMNEAVAFSNEFAPEHLLVATLAPRSILPALRNAGTIFLGERSSVSFGDYMTGANHVLPTGGLARSYSGLSVLDFVRWTTYQVVDAEAAQSLAEDVGVFADAEGLHAHAASARQWRSASGANRQ
ncbi:MAG: histidinol dehydrogenase [Gemmatimonadota bacterium]|nr:histidinol dehydrogenase [Gemmatimonadota bacterium]